MASPVQSYTNTDFPKIFNKFQEICPVNDLPHFLSMKVILEDPKGSLQKPWDIYPLYIHAMTIAKDLQDSKIPKLKERFIVILKAFSETDANQGTHPSIHFDFSHIIEMINRGTKELTCTSEIVDFNDDLKVNEAAVGIDALMTEGLGQSFGIPFLTTRIKSCEGGCVIARDEQNKIIATVLGTNLILPEKDTTVFHFNILVRSPKYPSINFTSMLEKFALELITKYNPDFLSLCVELDNPAKKLYEKFGFKEFSIQFNETLQTNAAYMVNIFNPGNKDIPVFEDVKAALNIVKKKEAENEMKAVLKV